MNMVVWLGVRLRVGDQRLWGGVESLHFCPFSLSSSSRSCVAHLVIGVVRVFIWCSLSSLLQ